MVFKPGDMVVISEPDDKMDGPSFVYGMEEFCGRHMTIKYLTEGYPDDGGWWQIEEDGGEFSWAGNWMKKVNKFKGNK